MLPDMRLYEYSVLWYNNAEKAATSKQKNAWGNC